MIVIAVHAVYVAAAVAGAAVIAGAVAAVLALSRGSVRTGVMVDPIAGRLPARFRVRARRGLEFWVPIPVAGLCYLSLRTRSWRDRHGLRRAWAELAGLLGQRHRRPERETSPPARSSAS